MKKEIKVAFVAIIGCVLLFFGMNFLKGISMFSNNYTYYIEFDDITGVGGNCPVYADGVKVGEVQGIDYDYDQKKPTRLTVMVDKNMRIPKGSQAEIISDLMGSSRINLLLANNMRERVNQGEVIRGINPEKLMARVSKLLPTIEAMVPKMDSIMSSLNTLLRDPAVLGTIRNAETVTGNLAVTTSELNTLVKTLNGSVPGMLQKADGVLADAQIISANLAQCDFTATMSEVDKTVKEVQVTLGKINSQEGTVGKLINSPELHDRLVNTIQDADSLVTDLKAHPKRYVHFSVFGRKN